MRTNVAQRILAYYSSKDFENDYSFEMYECYNDDENEILQRIKKILDDDGIKCSREQANLIYVHIRDNFEAFQGTIRNYWVGGECLESVSFGEQEEQLDGLYNPATKKNYNLKYLKRIFRKEGFFIYKTNYAYYDMSGGGLKITLKMTDEIKAILKV